MKIKNGFVSNSSTSSFLLFTSDKRITKKQIKQVCNKEIVNFIYKEKEKLDIERIRSRIDMFGKGKNDYKSKRMNFYVNEGWNVFEVLADSDSCLEIERELSDSSIYFESENFAIFSFLKVF